MIADKAFIEILRKKYKLNIPEDFESFLLEEYGKEPFPHEYTEQDLFEQIRKLEKKYHEGVLDVSLKDSELRLREQYETLKDEHIEIMYKVRNLEDKVEKLKEMLLKHGVDIFDAEEF